MKEEVFVQYFDIEKELEDDNEARKPIRETLISEVQKTREEQYPKEALIKTKIDNWAKNEVATMTKEAKECSEKKLDDNIVKTYEILKKAFERVLGDELVQAKQKRKELQIKKILDKCV